MSALADRLPRGRLAVDVSLWSAELGALGAEVTRLTPYADFFHIDASDTWFIPEPLFFPDLVAALRQHTPVPFHVHLMAQRAGDLVEAFARAGGDLITVHAEADDMGEALRRIRDCGKAAGLALTLDTAPETVAADLDTVDAVVMIGTPLGTKGSSMHPSAPGRIAAMRRVLAAGGRGDIVVFADGGIRSDTVPALAAAGADVVVAGSLLMGSADPAVTSAWLRSHSPATSAWASGGSR
ncbi:MAG: ribulose-phosphate 3-epimerase [Pseudonocardiaceae bacterium]